MRRLFRDIKINKSKEKKQHEILLNSINVDKQTKDEVSNGISLLKKELSSLIEEVKKNAIELKKYKGLVINEKDTFEKISSDVRKVESKNNDLVKELSLKRSELDQIKTDILDKNKEHSVQFAKLDKIEDEKISKKRQEVLSLEIEIQEKEERINILSKNENLINQSINDKKRELTAIGLSLEQREKELARINLESASTVTEIAEAKENMRTLDQRITDTKRTFAEFDEKINSKNDELKLKQDELDRIESKILGLVKREDKIEKDAIKIKSLYEKAGIKVNI